ncbi:MAG: GGDEF domain-containing protein, partial [Archangium sp.]
HGDAALVLVAGALTRGLRSRDVVARFGGDEFAILLPDTRAGAAVGIGERILTELAHESATFVGGLSVSIGVAELERLGSGAEVLAAADRALYWAKTSGGGRVALAPRSDTRAQEVSP